MVGWIRLRGHVYDNEPIDPVGTRERSLHGGLPAHRVTQHGGWGEVVSIYKPTQIRREGRVVHFVGVGRPSVIALIHRVDASHFLERRPAEGVPISVRPEKSVENDERWI